MARSEKRTTIKGLPPKVALGERAALTGSYPYVFHNGTVNRNVTWLPFNDQKVLNFTTQRSYLGLDFPTASNYIPSLAFVTTSLTGSITVRAGIADSFISLQRYGDISGSYQPFKDNDQFQAEGKSFGYQNAFWATGSNFDGLREPVWSKTKVEIDLTPLTASSMTGSRDNNVRTTSYVGYYNFTQRRWNQLVPTGPFNPGTTPGNSVYGSARQLLGGFSASHNRIYSNAGSLGYMNAGRPISSLGFPFADIYNATSSFCFPVSNIINRPFVVEKILVKMSASFRLSTLPGTLDDTFEQVDDTPYYSNGGVSSSYVVNNLFILNQRNIPTQKNLHIFYDEPTNGSQISLAYSSSLTSRDLIGWFEIASFNNDHNHVALAAANPNFYYRDYTIINSGTTASTTASWSRYMIMSASARTPKASVFNGITDPNLVHNLTTIQDLIYFVSLGATFMPVGWLGSRNGLLQTNVSGRDFRNVSQFKSDKTFFDQNDHSFQIGQSNDDWSDPNPYLLMPGDNLVIGWQLPTTDSIEGAFNSVENNPSSSFVEFPVAPAKIILYGSYLQDGDGTNDTSLQMLTSDNVHEAIE